MIYRLDNDLEIDDRLFVVRRRGEPLPIQRRVFDLVLYLVEHRDRVVGKRELLERVWPDATVGDSSLKHAVLLARRSLGAHGIIESVRGRGYRFVAAVTTVVKVAPAAAPRHLVGRTRELAGLRAALDAAIAGSGGMSLILGEPGIGKTRLLEELTVEAAARDVRVVWGRCWEMGDAPAFWPWQPLLGALVDAGATAEGLGALLGDSSAGEAGDPSLGSAARFQLFAAASRCITSLRDRPLLLLLDDLHAAGEPARLLLHFIARETGTARVLIVATARTPVADLERGAKVVVLQGLSPDEVGTLASSLGPPLSSRARSALHQTTQGNPLFIELVCGAGGVDAVAGSIPHGIREAVARRLAPPDAPSS